MSYRNDHDAALARIDALEAELGQSADARAKFASLEQQLAQAKRERDHALAEGRRGASWRMPTMLGVAAVAIIGSIGIAATRPHDPEPVVVAAPPPAPSTERAKLLACVAELDAHVVRRDASSEACQATLETEVRDAGLGTDIHETLVGWRDAERAQAWRDRERLAPAIHAYIIPSFTR